jgi:hypothetical protein
MELVLAGAIGGGGLVLIVIHGTHGGILFLASVAAYTLIRQGILHLRAEPSKSKVGRNVATVISALVLVLTIALLV